MYYKNLLNEKIEVVLRIAFEYYPYLDFPSVAKTSYLKLYYNS